MHVIKYYWSRLDRNKNAPAQNIFRKYFNPLLIVLFRRKSDVIIFYLITYYKEGEKKMLSHGGLYRWRENSLPIFIFQKLKEILTWYSRTILKASKN